MKKGFSLFITLICSIGIIAVSKNISYAVDYKTIKNNNIIRDAIIEVIPNNISEELFEGEVINSKIIISNSGQSDLIFSISKQKKKESSNSKQKKKESSNKNSSEQYKIIDSITSDNISFKWIDISNSGTQVSGLKDDNYIGPFPINFNFYFYDQIYNQFYIASNGFIGFGPPDNYIQRQNSSIPDQKLPNNFLAWCWDDLNSKNGKIYYETIDNMLIIQFDDYGQYGNSGTIDAQVILNENGSIIYQYKDISNEFISNKATIGIENNDGSNGLLAAFNENYIQNNLAVCFFPDQSEWLKIISESTVTVKPDESKEINIQLDASNLIKGIYQASLYIYSNDSKSPVIEIPVQLKIKALSPEIVINPESFNETVLEGNKITKKLGIQNTGNGVLELSLFFNSKNQKKIIEKKNSEIKNEANLYNWADSLSSSGPVFKWIDISQTGIEISGLKDDNYVGPFEIGFTFNFYNNEYNKFFVGSNGLIGFEDDSNLKSRNTRQIPSQESPNNFIAWLWSDLIPENGSVFYKSNLNQLIIQFIDYGQYGNSATVDAEVILEKNGNIIFQYKSFNNGFNVKNTTIGIENKEADQGLEIARNTDYLQNNLAIRISQNKPFVEFDNNYAKLASNESIDISLIFNAEKLSSGKYEGIILVQSNDLERPEIKIESVLNVEAADPIIEINPVQFNFANVEGSYSSAELTIKNKGIGNLIWEIQDKNKNENGNSYSFKDSDNIQGPNYNWIDIKDSGTMISDFSDDEFKGPFSIGFGFQYYGQTYTNFYISSNGFIGFGPVNDYSSRNNNVLPSSNTPNNILAWCYCDLNPDKGNVFYKTIDRKLIIQFDNFGQYKSSGTVFAQIILHQNGVIDFQYNSFKNGFNTDLCTVGIENMDGSIGITVAHKKPYLHDSLIIRFVNENMSWLNIAPSNGVIAPFENQKVNIIADSIAMPPGTYEKTISIISNDPERDNLSIPISMNIQASPSKIEIFPTKCEFNIYEGEEDSINLTISNKGPGRLIFNIDNIKEEYPNSIQKNIISNDFDIKNSESKYIWKTSNDPLGPKYNWIDISTTGISVPDLADDNYKGPFPIGFDFKYFENTYNEFYISSNGFIGFGPVDGYSSRNNDQIPSDRSPDNILALCWDDLQPLNGTVYYKTEGNKLIVQYSDYQQYGTKAIFNAEIILDSNGGITYQYKNFSEKFTYDTLTVGIENHSGDEGIQVVYNENFINEKMAVHFSNINNSILKISPLSGALASSESQIITAYVNALNMIEGNYNYSFIVRNNDPTNSMITIPVLVNITKKPAPHIQISHDGFEKIIFEGETAYENFSITNTGNALLKVNIKHKALNSKIIKSESEKFNYTWISSDQNQGFEYNWIDISESGTQVNGLKDDNFVGSFDIGFQFNYYGNNFDKFYIASNGYIGFGPTDGYNNRSPDHIPSNSKPDNFLAWCFEDLVIGDGSVFYKQLENMLIIQFNNYSQYRSNGKLTAQVILNIDGSIIFNYKEFSNDFVLDKSLIGIENQDGTKGLQISYKNDFIHNNFAIYVYNKSLSYISTEPDNAEISSLDSMDFVLTFDASNLKSGSYNSNMVINSNDPENSIINIPVIFKVVPAPPEISVSPLKLNYALNEGSRQTKLLNITNNGAGNLNWSISHNPILKEFNTNKTGKEIKNNSSYIFKTSDDYNGPSFNWIDISEQSETITGLKDDNYVGPFDIGFSFNFFGQSYKNFFVSSNGIIGFENSSSYDSRNNKKIPDENEPDNFIAWFWDDLDARNSSVYYKTTDNQLIIQFKDFLQYGSKGIINAQIILNKNGNFYIQYKDISDNFNTDTGTIGAENMDGNDGVLVSYNSDFIHESLCIQFQDINNIWLISSEQSGLLAQNQIKQLSITVDAQSISSGNYTGELFIDSNDPQYSKITIILAIEVLQKPEPIFSITPNKWECTLKQGSEIKNEFFIENMGNAPLIWEVKNVNKNLDKSSHPPDNYGYYFIDSDEIDGPDFNWIDISETGTEVTSIKDDNFLGPFDIGFEIDYYGNKYSSFYVASNGFIGFGPPVDYSNRSNQPIPSKRTPNNIIAVCFADMYPGSIFYKTIENKLVIQYKDYFQYGGNGKMNAEIIIHKNGMIFFNYKDFSNDFNKEKCSVGIENIDGTIGLEVVYNNLYLKDNHSIMFSPFPYFKWINASPLSGNILPYSSEKIIITLDGSMVLEGNYNCPIYFISNDAQNPQSTLMINVIVEPPVNNDKNQFLSSSQKQKIINNSFVNNSEDTFNNKIDNQEIISKTNNTDISTKGFFTLLNIPEFGERLKLLKGRVNLKSFYNLRILVYIYLDEWKIKPSIDNKITLIDNNGYFHCDITTEAFDHNSEKIAVFLVPYKLTLRPDIINSGFNEVLYEEALDYKVIIRK